MKLMLIGSLLALAAPAAQGGTLVDALGWMAGRWESVGGEGWTEELWAAPRGGAMIGFSRSGRGGEESAFEHLRIAPGEDGALVYLASPGGRPAVVFRLVERGEGSAAFANPDHDYPQLIRYRREGGTLTATISAADGSRAHTWTYRRAE
ncbi:DUF6265 family protein [Sphingosinicella terrae]|uniref:DUF6265 family protein n=1 Tax=Sphingosinicella terrae TaxID=2172047 RepID=UPI0025494A2D|nr:DUF6265 family protein [Sphingosinicella terrae]